MAKKSKKQIETNEITAIMAESQEQSTPIETVCLRKDNQFINVPVNEVDNETLKSIYKFQMHKNKQAQIQADFFEQLVIKSGNTIALVYDELKKRNDVLELQDIV